MPSSFGEMHKLGGDHLPTSTITPWRRWWWWMMMKVFSKPVASAYMYHLIEQTMLDLWSPGVVIWLTCIMETQGWGNWHLKTWKCQISPWVAQLPAPTPPSWCKPLIGALLQFAKMNNQMWHLCASNTSSLFWHATVRTTVLMLTRQNPLHFHVSHLKLLYLNIIIMITVTIPSFSNVIFAKCFA